MSEIGLFGSSDPNDFGLFSMKDGAHNMDYLDLYAHIWMVDEFPQSYTVDDFNVFWLY